MSHMWKPRCDAIRDDGSQEMRLSPRWLVLIPVLCGLSPSPSLVAQTSLAAGLTAGSAKLSAQRSDQALSGVLQVQARSWVSLCMQPSGVHVSDMVSRRAGYRYGMGVRRNPAVAL